MIVYGPVPSRRLGQSIGINNIPPKTCSYCCVYCQLGRTGSMQINRRAFYKPEDIRREARIKLKQLESENRQADFFSFVPDGEPTLDINLGAEIALLKQFNIKIAVITNGSLLWMDDVREDLKKADWVSVSLDAAEENTWHKINRPHGALCHKKILKGIIDFSKIFEGTLVTETMLVRGINDHSSAIIKIGEQLSLIQPSKAYILVPTRPPAEKGVERASKTALSSAERIIHSISGIDVECITEYEKEEGFFLTESVKDDLLSIASVHPIREDIIDAMLRKSKTEKSLVSELLEQKLLVEFIYEGKKFYRRNI